MSETQFEPVLAYGAFEYSITPITSTKTLVVIKDSTKMLHKVFAGDNRVQAAKDYIRENL